MKRGAPASILLGILLVACALVLASVPSLHAGFLEMRIRESTAEHVWNWASVLFALIVILTLRASRSKGGQGR